jgi:leucyl aminopeptidase
MLVLATTDAPGDCGADTIAVGVFAGEAIAHDVEGGILQALVDSGEARPAPSHVAVAHAAGRRWILAGLGERDRFTAERGRAAAAAVYARSQELSSRSLCWELPHHVGDETVAALVEGTLLAAYRFDAFKREPDDEPPPALERLMISAHHDVSGACRRADVIARAQNAARDLQNRPPNDLTPAALARRAQELAGEIDGLSADVEGREQIVARGMGAFAAVAQGADEEPALITLRWSPPGSEGRMPAALIGKAVTFDSGGISIKPAAGMEKLKFDMSGGAAVLEAVGALARLGHPRPLIGVIGATENLPSASAVLPGDIVRAMDGTTIEVNNTDAEGRLVLADCILHARELGAAPLVDVATLTGGVVVALGSVYAGVMSSDDTLWEQLRAAGERSGELVWRMPLHERYAKALEGRYGDLVNSTGERKAHPIMGGEFLHHFAGDVPWAHIDIAGMSDDLDLPHARKGGSGWGVRLLVELAASLAESPA